MHDVVTGSGVWAIECLVRGDKAEANAQRFAQEGVYSQIPYQEHVLVDFRKGAQSVRKLRDNFIYVCFFDDFQKAKIRRNGANDELVNLAP